jgi:hypothetical protein
VDWGRGNSAPFFLKKLLDYDPLTGLKQIFHHDSATEVSMIETVQDVEPFLEIAKAARNDEDYSKDGIKENWWHIAYLPDFIIIKMINEDGVNIYNRNDWPKLGQLLNDKYSKFKMTDGQHKLKG